MYLMGYTLDSADPSLRYTSLDVKEPTNKKTQTLIISVIPGRQAAEGVGGRGRGEGRESEGEGGGGGG